MNSKQSRKIRNLMIILAIVWKLFKGLIRLGNYGKLSIWQVLPIKRHLVAFKTLLNSDILSSRSLQHASSEIGQPLLRREEFKKTVLVKRFMNNQNLLTFITLLFQDFK